MELETKAQRVKRAILGFVYDGATEPKLCLDDLIGAGRVGSVIAVRLRSRQDCGLGHFDAEAVRFQSKYGGNPFQTLECWQVRDGLGRAAIIVECSYGVAGYFRDLRTFSEEAARSGWLVLNDLRDIDNTPDLDLLRIWNHGHNRSVIVVGPSFPDLALVILSRKICNAA